MTSPAQTPSEERARRVRDELLKDIYLFDNKSRDTIRERLLSLATEHERALEAVQRERDALRRALEVTVAERDAAVRDLSAVREELGRLRARTFPVLQAPLGAPTRVPWAFLAPFEGNAKRNHDQDLEKLASRGGLGVAEMMAVVEGKRLREMDSDEVALPRLLAALRAFEDKQSGLTTALARAERAERDLSALRRRLEEAAAGDTKAVAVCRARLVRGLDLMHSEGSALLEALDASRASAGELRGMLRDIVDGAWADADDKGFKFCLWCQMAHHEDTPAGTEVHERDCPIRAAEKALEPTP